MTQFINMIVSYNEYNKTEYRRKFYIQPRTILNNGNYEPCHTEYNAKYSDEYDFYHAIEENGGGITRRELYRGGRIRATPRNFIY